MSDLVLSRIRLYPIKGCNGADVQIAQMDKRGLCYDRRWLLVNELGLGLQQFDNPRLSMVTVSLVENGLRVQAPAMPTLHVPLQPQHTHPITAKWYRGSCEALPVSRQADEWFQHFMNMYCRLVFMPEETQRFVEPTYALDRDLAAFTSFPYHLLGESSFNDLNQRLETPVPLDRFRPNLVIAGAPPFAEDQWRTFKINQHTFHTVRPCDRCAITTVDASVGVRTNKEPLKTLARYRTFQQKVLFGQYLLSRDTGTLHVGDPVHILEFQDPVTVL